MLPLIDVYVVPVWNIVFTIVGNIFSSAVHYFLIFSLFFLSLLSIFSSLVVPVLSDLAQCFSFTYIILILCIHVSSVVIRRCVGKLAM